jgi:hypothetical protein
VIISKINLEKTLGTLYNNWSYEQIHIITTNIHSFVLRF